MVSGAKSLSKASSNKGSRHGHVGSISPPCFSIAGEGRLFDDTGANGTGEALGLLVSGTVYVFLMVEAGLLGTADSLFGTVIGLDSFAGIAEQTFFDSVIGLELLGTLAILEILGTVTGLAIFGTGLESFGIDTGLVLLGTASGLALFGMVTGLGILETVSGLALFGTGLESLRTVAFFAAASGLGLIGTGL